MGLIDNIGAVPFSASKAFSSVITQPKFSAWTIEMVKDTLVSAGWTLSSSLPATTTISYPTGFPSFAGTGSGVVGCGGNALVITTATRSFRFCPYVAGQSPNGAGGPCIQFALGTSPSASLTNLCGAISTTPGLPYTATLTTSPELVITLTANTAGPFSNFDTVVADGRFGTTNGTILGGGYVLASTGPSPYSFAIYGQVGVDEQGIQFDFTMGPSGHTGICSYYLGTNGVIEYNVAANPYSFALFDGVTSLRSIASFAPDVLTSEGFTSAYCVFVVGPNGLTDRLLWQGISSISLDAAPITLGDSLRGPQALLLRAGGVPAVTLNGQPLLTAAYAMMAPDYTSAPSVVGKLWDCQVVTKTLDVGGTYQTGGRNYVVIASQDGTNAYTPASLLFCVDDNGQ